MIRRELLWALLLLVAVNGLVLAGVAWNRSGIEAELVLSERELPLERFRDPDDNSGMALHLDWHQWGGKWPWLDRAKLAELGFDVAALSAVTPDHERHASERKAYLVLEFNGPAWVSHQAAQQAELLEIAAELASGKLTQEQADNRRFPVEGDLLVGSRLFAVDAGRDPTQLRQRYPDRSRYLLVAARFGVHPYALRSPIGKDNDAPGYIEQVLVDSLHLPRDLQTILASLPSEGRLTSGYRYYDGKQPLAPGYEVQVKWGRRFEPWVAGITLLGRK